jgi:hypothetical protein
MDLLSSSGITREAVIARHDRVSDRDVRPKDVEEEEDRNAGALTSSFT